MASFDHHCVWLNNCVGGRNLWSFYGLLISAQLAAVLHLGVSVYVLTISMTGGRVTAEQLCEHFSCRFSLAGLRAVAGVNIGMSAVVSAALAELSCFHLYLCAKGMTTHEYIVRQRSVMQSRRCGRALDAMAMLYVRTAAAYARQQRHMRARGLCMHRPGQVTPSDVQLMESRNSERGPHKQCRTCAEVCTTEQIVPIPDQTVDKA